MGKPHPIELRERVVGYVEEGHTHRASAERFRVSPRFVNDMVILKRETGCLEAKPQGHGGAVGKLSSTMSPSTRANARRNWCASEAHGCCSCRLTRLTSIQ